MPMTINGFGTSVCGSRGDVGWGSYDGMEWIVAFMMPLIPIKCVHTFDWNGEQYRTLPIRWSFELMARTFLARWLWGFVLAAFILGIIAFVDRSGFNPILLFIAFAFVLIAIGIGVILHLTDKRNKNIRIVLGAVTVGNCDPAHFTNDLLDELGGNPRARFGTKTFGEAAEVLLKRGSYANAMWAARLCVALESSGEGESLTNEILNDPDVIDAIERVRKNANKWEQLMLTDEDRAPAEAPPSQQDWSESEEMARDGDRRRDRDDDRYRGRDRDDDDRRRRDDDEDRPRRRRRDRDDDY